jgi:hypothetical protein
MSVFIEIGGLAAAEHVLYFALLSRARLCKSVAESRKDLIAGVMISCIIAAAI